MNSVTPAAPNAFAAELVRRGLPIEYAKRAAEEFADHQRDLIDELQATGMSASQAVIEASHRLGDAQMLVKRTVREYQRRYWCARWPILSFVVVPPLAYVVAVCLTGAGLIPLLSLVVGIQGGPQISDPIVKLCVGYVLGVTLFHIVPALVAIGFTRIAHRAACGKMWIIASCLGIGLMAAIPVWMTNDQQFFFTIAIESVELVVRSYMLNPWQWFQLTLPLAVGLGLHWILDARTRRQYAKEDNDVHVELAA